MIVIFVATYSLKLLVLDFSAFFIRFNIFDLPWRIVFYVMLELGLDFLSTWFSLILNNFRLKWKNEF